MRWIGHVARGEIRRKKNIRRECEDSIKLNLREMRWNCMDWIDLAKDRNQWRALVNTVMNLRVSIKFWNILE
jgi:hypothetical protein